jgi:hypothetical protein
VAAPFAAYLVRHVSLPVLGALVGSVILVTNGITILQAFSAESPLAFGALGVTCVVLVAIAVRKTRRQVPAPAPAAQPEREPAAV